VSINLYGKVNINGTEYPCTDTGTFQDTVSHELGHVLGLNNVSASCSGYIMGPRVHQGNGSFADRQVNQQECDKVAETNVTPSESSDPCASPLLAFEASGFSAVAAPILIPCDEGGGEGGGPGGSGDPSVTNSGSPILVDLDRSGFKLTTLSSGVRFDLDGDGWPERISWTRPDSGDAWLALDRNGNGLIDRGSELFGNYTEQPATDNPHGYLALAVFDAPAAGGNGDGVISIRDEIYTSLRLWLDRNHDGVSQPSELLALSDVGVEWLGLHYIESGRQDRHGNEFQYTSLVGLAGHRTQSSDVFLLRAP